MPQPIPHIRSAPRPGPARPSPRNTPIPFSEVFPAGIDGAAAGFVAASIGRGTAPVLWLQDRLSRRETGRPYLPGLGGALLLMDLSRPADVLAAAEEGLRCRALSAVVAEIWGNPSAVDFRTTKRLALRAEASGVPCWLIRHAAQPGLSAARERWRVASLPSPLHPDDARAPGLSRWRAELFRSRSRAPGLWQVTHDPAADRLDLVAGLPDGTLAEAGTPKRQRLAR